MNHLEEIRAKLSIEELVGGYLQLKKAGRNLKGLCPFHNDSKPSLMVSPEKGIAYCFACNNGGDIFKFIQLIENVDFPEAVRILAERTGVSLPEFKPESHNERMRTIEINAAAVSFFTEKLEESPEHMRYFTERGLSEATIKKFKLGYAPDSYTALKDHLIKLGYGEGEILKAGLLNQRSLSDKNTYDRFRNRYIFPIFDHQDNPVGFGGRIIGAGEPKYLNSPDTPAYNKSYVLYGLNHAKEAIKRENLAVFVEGYMDVISAHQAGTGNVVATSGTALTDIELKKDRPKAEASHLKLIRRYTTNIAYAFDADNAGIEATKRSIELTKESEPDLNLKIIMIPEGKDPDECIKASPEKWINAIQNAVPVMDFYFDYALRQFNPDTMEGKKGIIEILFPLIKQYPTEMEQGQYLEKLAFHIKSDIRLLWNDLKKFSVKKTYTSTSKSSETPQKKTVFTREEFLLGFIFQMPQLYELVEKNLIDTIPFDPATEKFYKACKNVYNRLSMIDVTAVKEELDPADAEKINVYSLLADEYYPDSSEELCQREVISLIHSINRNNLHNVQKDYEFKIRSASDSGEKILLLNQYNQILKLAAKLK